MIFYSSNYYGICAEFKEVYYAVCYINPKKKSKYLFSMIWIIYLHLKIYIDNNIP